MMNKSLFLSNLLILVSVLGCDKSSSSLDQHYNVAQKFSKIKVTSELLTERFQPGECLIGSKSFSPDGPYYSYHVFFPQVRCVRFNKSKNSCEFTEYELKFKRHNLIAEIKNSTCDKTVFVKLAKLDSPNLEFRNALANYIDYDNTDPEVSSLRFHSIVWKDKENQNNELAEAYNKVVSEELSRFVKRRKISGPKDPRYY